MATPLRLTLRAAAVPITARATAVVAAVAALALALVPLDAGVSYGIRSATAVVAVVVLLRLGTGPGRRSRALLAGALLAGIGSGLAATSHLVLTGQPTPPGGLADWLYLAYGPLAAAGLLALPRHAEEGPWRLRALADATLVVSSLAFVLAELMLDMARTGGQSLTARAAALGYPVNAVFVLAVLLAVLPRSQPALRPFLRVAGSGLALMTLSDVAYSVGALHGWYTPTTWPAVVSEAGLVLVALSPLSARTRVTPVDQAPGAPSLIETAAPFLAVAPAIVLSVTLVLEGTRYTVLQMALALLIGVALIARQLLSNVEQRHSIERLRRREQEALAAALRDPLTQLANRSALYDELTVLLRRPERGGVALALLDLDDFKDINDTHGHETGDAVLCDIAARLRSAVPVGALVARLGGDEFAVCSTGQPTSELAEALLMAFDQPVVVGHRHFSVTASIGVILADAGGATAAVALSHVDVAMYEAKARKDPHCSGVVVLDGQARADAAARVQMRDDVSRLDLEQFRMVYEPFVDLGSGEVVGAEALLRWQHPVLGPVPPGEFIPLAEQVGAIAQLGEFALRTAVGALAGWIAEAERTGSGPLRACVSVNLSPRQLGLPGLCDLVREVLADHDLEPSRLVLEITEEALLGDWETAVQVVQELRGIGVGVAVDDFGTGYSSLRYLRRFDTSTVKIDREFVQAVVDEPRTRALVASVLDMARSLDLFTVAEGIETVDQLQVLRTLGCRFAQGYLFSKPMETDAFGALLLSRHHFPMTQAQHTLDLPWPRQVLPGNAPIRALTVTPRLTG